MHMPDGVFLCLLILLLVVIRLRGLIVHFIGELGAVVVLVRRVCIGRLLFMLVHTHDLPSR